MTTEKLNELQAETDMETTEKLHQWAGKEKREASVLAGVINEWMQVSNDYKEQLLTWLHGDVIRQDSSLNSRMRQQTIFLPLKRQNEMASLTPQAFVSR